MRKCSNFILLHVAVQFSQHRLLKRLFSFFSVVYFCLLCHWLPWCLRCWSICLQCRRPGFDPWVGKIPEDGNGNPLQYSCLENPMDGEAWWATVHGVAKSQTGLSDFTFTFTLSWINWPYAHEFISVLFILFNWSMYLFMFYYHTLLMPVLLYYSLKSGNVIPLALFLFPSRLLW